MLLIQLRILFIFLIAARHWKAGEYTRNLLFSWTFALPTGNSVREKICFSFIFFPLKALTWALATLFLKTVVKELFPLASPVWQYCLIPFVTNVWQLLLSHVCYVTVLFSWQKNGTFKFNSLTLWDTHYERFHRNDRDCQGQGAGSDVKGWWHSSASTVCGCHMMTWSIEETWGITVAIQNIPSYKSNNKIFLSCVTL